MTGDVVLQTFNLSKQFRTRSAVKDVNLRVHKGDVFGFLGPNGAGKSTTIRMLLTLISPSSGHIELFGERLHRGKRAVLSKVGGLVERPDFYLYLTARRNLEIVGALKGGIPSSAITEVLDIVGLAARADDKVKTYSHGMKQRLGIAQAILGSPEFIVLDEPTSGLDPQGIKEVRELIVRLSSERGITIFLSSHLLNETEQTATNMAVISAGELVVQGKVSELLDSGDNSVRVDARPIERAMQMIEQQDYVTAISRDNDSLIIKMPRDRIHALNSMLVQAEIQVDALVPKRSLEEYFLQITEGASDDNAPKGKP